MTASRRPRSSKTLPDHPCPLNVILESLKGYGACIQPWLNFFEANKPVRFLTQDIDPHPPLPTQVPTWSMSSQGRCVAWRGRGQLLLVIVLVCSRLSKRPWFRQPLYVSHENWFSSSWPNKFIIREQVPRIEPLLTSLLGAQSYASLGRTGSWSNKEFLVMPGEWFTREYRDSASLSLSLYIGPGLLLCMRFYFGTLSRRFGLVTSRSKLVYAERFLSAELHRLRLLSPTVGFIVAGERMKKSPPWEQSWKKSEIKMWKRCVNQMFGKDYVVGARSVVNGI